MRDIQVTTVFMELDIEWLSSYLATYTQEYEDLKEIRVVVTGLETM